MLVSRNRAAKSFIIVLAVLVAFVFALNPIKAASPLTYGSSLNNSAKSGTAYTATDLDLRAYVKATLYYVAGGAQYSTSSGEKSQQDYISVTLTAASSSYLMRIESDHKVTGYSWVHYITANN